VTQTLWAVEAWRGGTWILLPNIIMVDRLSVEFELKCLRKEENSKAPEYRREKYRLVSYERRANGKEESSSKESKRQSRTT
jgi:hypothetical protein